eukprot:CAMPEP_0197027288 /NCGR_PEP_ID=MMETSP1384-20130603/7232_1 /TAXON_ID=29189 /ORGANISM="Ammonia sp." /LENGTH=260 /DNA_ID=CAMNT_0042456115 /DNA_START=5 /DNA_END=784 /DNA_ORIENTATION=+
MAQTYVQLGGKEEDDGSDDDELGSTLSSASSKIRSRASTPWSQDHKPPSHMFVSAQEASLQDEILANWKIYCLYKSVLCVMLLLFSMGSVSSGESFRDYENDNESLVCDASRLSGDVKETNLFGDFSVAALMITLVLCIWCFFSYIRMRLVYHNTERKITTMDVAHARKLQKIDIMCIVTDFIVLTIAVAILGTDISGDIANIADDCPDNVTYPYDATRAESISTSFNVLHALYWVSIAIVFMFIFTVEYALRGSNKDKW